VIAIMSCNAKEREKTRRTSRDTDNASRKRARVEAASPSLDACGAVSARVEMPAPPMDPRVEVAHMDPRSMDPRAMNAELLAARGASAILALIGERGHGYNAVNCATALSRLVSAPPAGGVAAAADPRVAQLLRRTIEVLAGAGGGGGGDSAATAGGGARGGGGSGGGRGTPAAAANARTLTSIAHSLVALGRAAEPSYGGSGGAVGGSGGPRPAHAGETQRLLDALLGAVLSAVGRAPHHRDPAAPGAVATALWALGTRRAASATGGSTAVRADDAAVWGVCHAAAALAARMSPAEVANAAWGAARARVRAPALMSALAVAATRVAEGDGFTPQGLANVAFAWAKLRLRADALFGAIAAAACRLLARCGPRVDGAALATLSWAFARCPSAALTGALTAALARPGVIAALPPHAVASLLQSLSGGESDDAPGVADGSVEGGGGGGAHAGVLAALGDAALKRLDALGASEVGLLAGAVVRGAVRVPPATGVVARRAMVAALAARVAAVAARMDWRGVAAAELALRMLLLDAQPECDATTAAAAPAADDHGHRDAKAVAAPARFALSCGAEAAGADTVVDAAIEALTRRAAAAAGEIAAASDAAASAPSELLVACLRDGRLALPPVVVARCAAARPRARALLIGDDPSGIVRRALHDAGWRAVSHWRRFACDRGGGSSSELPPAAMAPPRRPCGAAYDAVVARVAPSAEGALLVARGAAAAMDAGAPLVLFGASAEGAAGHCGTEGLFVGLAIAATAPDGSVVLCCKRAAAAGEVPWGFDADASSTPLQLPAVASGADDDGAAAARRRVPWVTYSAGLFAGGGVDVMTAALLAALPRPPPRARVLDFACGSGVIGAALLAAEPSLRLGMCDADAVAVAAARVNVPGAGEVVLADGWDRADGGAAGDWPRHRLDWIVSNPPVHRGVPDDLRVLSALLAGAPARLRRGGSLWIVTQAQVPVARLAAAAALDAGAASAGAVFEALTATAVAGGRFVVWRAVVATGE
jgi:hypothetical protein